MDMPAAILLARNKEFIQVWSPLQIVSAIPSADYSRSFEPFVFMHLGSSLEYSYDIGHSSIGWCVLKACESDKSAPEILGCGVVTFRPDDCLASKRRDFRRQRRHIRSTRQRIRRMRLLLSELGAVSMESSGRPGCMSPWSLATEALEGKRLLTWPELWDVLRFYAHNRGYDGNRRWSSNTPQNEDEEDTQKVENAKGLMREMKKGTMAETMTAYVARYEREMAEFHGGARSERPVRFKGKNTAFPRETIEAEVRRILETHFGKLQGCDEKLAKTLLEDWQAIACQAIKLPLRYKDGLLFGQLVPRFDNRIIAECPVSGQKVPSRDAVEFYRFRWAMVLANVLVASESDRKLRPLSADERKAIHQQMEARGAMNVKEFKLSVASASAAVRSNLDQLFLHPDSKEALLLDPARAKIVEPTFAAVWPHLTPQVQKRAIGRLRQGKTVRLAELCAENSNAESAIRDYHASVGSKKRKGEQLSIEALLNTPHRIELQQRRAPYARKVLQEVFEYSLETGRHPMEAGGPLFVTEERRKTEEAKEIDERTNNHLIRHRLKVVQRLHRDLRVSFPGAIRRVVVEVNRDLRTFSGMTAKEKAQDLGQRLANHDKVSAKLERDLAPTSIPITPGLIRKARIADDLNWTCPYTGQPFDAVSLANRAVDKDHIIPRSQRTSDSLDSLVITFSEVNRMKGQRTAMQFVEECGGKSVDGADHLMIQTPTQFRAMVARLDVFKGHEDDKRRKKRRKELLQLKDYTEREFTPGDLTQTSQLVRMAVAVLRNEFKPAEKADQQGRELIQFTSMPGSVTGATRRGWHLLGCLSAANPQVLDSDGSIKTKTEIREISHLHHALDACVLALTSHYFPRNGALWELMVKRNLNQLERSQLQGLAPGRFSVTREGRFEMTELDASIGAQIRARLAECRVVQHLPQRLSGLRVEQNTWRVVKVEDGIATIRQSMRGPDGTRKPKETTERVDKLIGPNPTGAGKLARIKGALVIPDNYGIALDPQPLVIPFHKVWTRLAELKQKNGGKPPRVLRNGQLIHIPRGRYAGVWRIFSIKNNTSGMALDIGRPDVVKLQNKTEGHRINVLLASVIRDGLEPLTANLAGPLPSALPV